MVASSAGFIPGWLTFVIVEKSVTGFGRLRMWTQSHSFLRHVMDLLPIIFTHTQAIYLPGEKQCPIVISSDHLESNKFGINLGILTGFHYLRMGAD